METFFLRIGSAWIFKAQFFYELKI
jgi:hypothetical protein